MNKLEYGLKLICDRNRDGSFATQSNRRRMLSLFVDQLKSAGFKVNHMQPQDLKGRHINALLKKWQEDGVTTGTIKNRMAALRWWAEKIGNAGAVKSNEQLGIENRVYVTNESKAQSLEKIDLSQCSPEIAQSLQLQAAFGLRREEAMKFQPVYALGNQNPDTATKIFIKGSWAKGGRDREIPLTNAHQRAQLRAAAALVGSGSLIPPNKTYKAHLASFEAQTSTAGIGQTHGLRHAYAQTRYRELMGFDCPALSVETRKLTPEERQKDQAIRLKISEELGHSRINITSVYIGSWSKK